MVDVHSKPLDAFPANRREVLGPEGGVTKRRDDFSWEFHLPHDVILVLDFTILGQGRQVWRIAIVGEFELKFLGCG